MLRMRDLLLLALLGALCLTVTVHAQDEEEDLGGGGDDGGDAGDAPPEEEEEEDANVDESDVIVLTDKNFDETVKGNKHLLVEFYAPWCGHCKQLKPEYASAATDLKKADPPVALAKLDSTKFEKISTEYKVEGFPTLKFFTEGTPKEYTGGRTAKEIVSWCKKHSGDPTVKLADDAALKKLIDENNVVVVGYFADKGDLATAFGKAALLGDLTFAEGNAAVASARGASTPSVVVYKNFDDPTTVYDGKADEEEISKFASAAARPTVFEFKEDKVEAMFNNDLHKVALFTFNDAALAAFKEAAARPSVKGKLIFMYVGNDEDPNFFEYVGVNKDDKDPQVLAIDAVSGKKYKYADATVTADGVEKFAQDVMAGKVKPFLKSEKEPESNDGPLKVFTGNTFQRDVMDADKHVVVEFYAPWCGHCKQLEPIYAKAAELLQTSHPDDVVVGKIDGTLNEVDHEKVQVEGFPTILVFPKGKKDDPVDISSKPRKTAKALVASIGKVIGVDMSRPGEEKYRNAVARLKKVLKAKPELLEFVAAKLEAAADETDKEFVAKGGDKSEL